MQNLHTSCKLFIAKKKARSWLPSKFTVSCAPLLSDCSGAHARRAGCIVARAWALPVSATGGSTASPLARCAPASWAPKPKQQQRNKQKTKVQLLIWSKVAWDAFLRRRNAANGPVNEFRLRFAARRYPPIDRLFRVGLGIFGFGRKNGPADAESQTGARRRGARRLPAAAGAVRAGFRPHGGNQTPGQTLRRHPQGEIKIRNCNLKRIW